MHFIHCLMIISLSSRIVIQEMHSVARKYETEVQPWNELKYYSRQTDNKYVHLQGRPHIHTCRSYVHAPRDIDRDTITEEIPTLNFTSGWVGDSSDFGLVGE